MSERKDGDGSWLPVRARGRDQCAYGGEGRKGRERELEVKGEKVEQSTGK